MEFPYGHPHHHHHHHQSRDDEEEEDRQSFGPPPPGNNFADAPARPGLYQSQPHLDPYAGPPAPAPYRSEPYFEAPSPPPPFGQVSHVGHHTSNESYPPDHRYGGYPPQSHGAPSPPPPFGQVSHVGHHTSNESHPPDHRHEDYPPPSHGDRTGVMHVSHHNSHEHDPHLPSDENRQPDNLAGLAGRPTVKVYSKAEPNYYLTIRAGKVILAPSDPSDEAQHWYKDEKYSTRVKDAEGNPCFALVNKATGEAMKHSVGATHPVHLIRYDPDKLDESVLWTESKDLGDGYRTIRMINNVRLLVDAYHGDSKSGGVRDGTPIVLWDWNKGDNQRWKIFPFCKLFLLNLSCLVYVILLTL